MKQCSSNSHFLECDCGHNKDHNIWFEYHAVRGTGEPMMDELYINAQLNHFLPLRKRLMVAIKYVLGIDNTYKNYTEIVISKEDEVRSLRDYLDTVLSKFNK